MSVTGIEHVKLSTSVPDGRETYKKEVKQFS